MSEQPLCNMDEKIDEVLATLGPILLENKDVSIAPEIPARKLKRALRAYGQSIATADQVRLLVDNTVLRSAKEGLMITATHLLCKTGPSGVLAIHFSDIFSVMPDMLHVGPVPIPGIRINREHFIALPGMAQPLETFEQPALFLLTVLFHQTLGISPDSGEDEGSDFLKSDFIKSDFNKSDFSKHDRS